MRARAAVLAALSALALAGCGGGGDEPASPAELVASAIRTNDAAESYRTTMRLDSDLGGQAIELAGTARANADSTRMIGDFTFRQGRDEPFRMRMLLVDGKGYVRSPALADALPKGKQWMQMGDDTFSQQSLTPKQLLDLLRETPKVEKVGEETIRGAETVHLRGPLDMAKVADRVGSGPVYELVRDQPELVERMRTTLDVWIDEDAEQIQRMAMSLRVDGQRGEMRFSGDVLDYDVSLADVKPPPSGQVVKEREVGR